MAALVQAQAAGVTNHGGVGSRGGRAASRCLLVRHAGPGLVALLVVALLAPALDSKDLRDVDPPRTFHQLRAAMELDLARHPFAARMHRPLRTHALEVAFLGDSDLPSKRQRVELPEFFTKYIRMYAAAADRLRVNPREDKAAQAVAARPHLEGAHAIVAQHLVLNEAHRATRMQHASTVVEVAPGELLAAWFAGLWEGESDAGIWLSRFKDGAWSEQAWQVAHPLIGKPCWNPVLMHDADSGETVLFFKLGKDPETWRPYVMRSLDKGATWTPRKLTPRPFLGPAKNKVVTLPDGTWLAGSSNEAREVWTAHAEFSRDRGISWHRTADVDFEHSVIQPAIIEVPGALKMLLRSGHGWTVESNSTDGGQTWSPGRNTTVKNPNSGMDAVTLTDGRILMVYNPTRHARSILVLDVSSDGGETFRQAVVLELTAPKVEVAPECHDPLRPEAEMHTDLLEFSYPAIIQAQDGLVHVTYTYSYFGFMKRCSSRENIKHVVIDPTLLE